jgi:hypothetical protein
LPDIVVFLVGTIAVGVQQIEKSVKGLRVKGPLLTDYALSMMVLA